MSTAIHKKNKSSGFTIVELLIVIVVIAILAAISIIAYTGIQNRSKITAIANDIKQLDKAFRLFATSEGRSTWWIDEDLAGGNNPSIATLISQTNLKNYYQKLSPSTIAATSNVRYDNDGDAYSGCGGSTTAGVNIYFYDIPQDTVQSIDATIDDGDLACGNITYGGASLRYNISKVQGF